MKKFLFILILFFSIFSYSQAEINEPGKINSLKCAVGALDAYFELKEYLEKKPKLKGVVYLACDTSSGEYSWTWQSFKNIEKAHTKAFKNCTKHSKKRGTGECFLFSENQNIVWQLSERRMAMFKKTLAKKRNNETTEEDIDFTFDGRWNVKSKDNDFVKYKKQKNKLKILDIGVGSGCILLSILCENLDFRGIGIDISKKSIDLCKTNVIKFGLENREMQVMDWIVVFCGVTIIIGLIIISCVCFPTYRSDEEW